MNETSYTPVIVKKENGRERVLISGSAESSYKLAVKQKLEDVKDAEKKILVLKCILIPYVN